MSRKQYPLELSWFLLLPVSYNQHARARTHTQIHTHHYTHVRAHMHIHIHTLAIGTRHVLIPRSCKIKGQE